MDDLRYVEEPSGLIEKNAIRLLRSGDETFAAWLSAIHQAQKRISMEMYIFDDDRIGKEFASALSSAARRGVEVRLLYDAVGCRHASARFFQQMRSEGVLAIAYHPTRFWRPRFWTLIRRNHRKTLICDGQIAFTGGVNISDAWLSIEAGGFGWKDAAVEVVGPAVQVVEQIFLRTWNWRAKRRHRYKRKLNTPPTPVGNVPVSIIANRELLDRFAIRRAAIHAIRASQSRIYLVSPYFVPDLGFLRALSGASQRGVDVRLILPLNSDTRIVDYACRATLGRLLPSGVRVFLQNPMVHAKALVVDDVFVSLGSYNFDHRSLVYNLELVVNTLDRPYNQEVTYLIQNYMTTGQELSWETYRRRSWLTRLLERMAYWLRHWL
jgi:cardiolipin synthase